MRKRAGVTPLDPVEFFYHAGPWQGNNIQAATASTSTSSSSAPAAAAQANGGAHTPVASLAAEHQAYFASALGAPLLPLADKPPSGVVLETEW